MSNQNVVRRLGDVRELANKVLGKCVCVRIDETHAKGYMGVKIVLGYKINPIFDPNANPDKPDLKPQERILERQKANPRAADVRILWLRPGITTQELVDEYLSPMKKSLDKASPISVLETKKEVKSEKTDEELAAMLDGGVGSAPEADFDDEDEDYEEQGFDDESIAESIMTGDTEDSQSDEEFEEDEDGDIVGKKTSNVSVPKASELSEIMGALQTLSSNIMTVNDNVTSLADRVTKVEKSKKTSKKK